MQAGCHIYCTIGPSPLYASTIRLAWALSWRASSPPAHLTIQSETEQELYVAICGGSKHPNK